MQSLNTTILTKRMALEADSSNTGDEQIRTDDTPWLAKKAIRLSLSGMDGTALGISERDLELVQCLKTVFDESILEILVYRVLSVVDDSEDGDVLDNIQLRLVNSGYFLIIS